MSSLICTCITSRNSCVDPTFCRWWNRRGVSYEDAVQKQEQRMIPCYPKAGIYTNELKSWFLAASAWQQIFGLHLRLAIQQWSLAPDAKIGAASLPKFQLLSSFV